MTTCTVVCFKGERGSQNGETAKADSLISLSKKLFDRVLIFSTSGWKRNPIGSLRLLKKNVKNSQYVFLVLARNGALYLGRYLIGYCHKRGIKIFYFMVGVGPIRSEIVSLRDKSQDSYLRVTHYFQNEKEWRLSTSSFSKVLPFFDRVFVESPTIKRVCDFIYNAKNVSLLVNFRADEALVNRSDWPKPEITRPLHFVFFARVTPEKGIFTLIKICRQLHSEGFKFFLDIYGNLQIPLENLLTAIGDDKGIEYCGLADGNQTRLLAQYDAVVFPTECSEGMPGTLTEAMLAGTPIVTSDFTFARDIVKNGVTGYIYPFRDAEGLHLLLCDLIAHPHKLFSLRENCYKKALEYIESSSIDVLKKAIS